MEKVKKFKRTFFDAEFIEKAAQQFIKQSDAPALEKCYRTLRVTLEHEMWRHDTLEEFLADYAKGPKDLNFEVEYGGYQLGITFDDYSLSTNVSIKAPTRKEVESLFNFFEQNAKKFYIEPPPPAIESDIKDSGQEEIAENNSPSIFIGHGRSGQWRDLKDHLQDKHQYNVIAYETGARAGHSIRDILESMLEESSFAILVFTGEDKTADGLMHARQNVIHEAGLFQGSLGFNRAIILLEEGTEDMSNVHGIQQIRYSKNNIKETFGDVLATLKREFE
jgi:predicted nucleotide-binding protein